MGAGADLMLERMARAMEELVIELPGAGGLRGCLQLTPAASRAFARAARKAALEYMIADEDMIEAVIALLGASSPPREQLRFIKSIFLRHVERGE